MRNVSFVTPLHTSSKRNYIERMTPEKPMNMRVASLFGRDYWDGLRCFGYGGYRDDGRWESVADEIIKFYGLRHGSSVLDIGCGKGFLVSAIKRRLGMKCLGVDVSEYGVQSGNLSAVMQDGRFGSNIVMDCRKLDFPDDSFDFTYSINVLHNLGYTDLKRAIREMVRVTRTGSPSYICVESYRNEEELCNLQCWALTCKSFYSPSDWRQILEENGYQGDVEFIFFE